MNSIEILREVINGLDNVITDTEKNDGLVWLAKEVKKDLLDVIKSIQREQGRIG